MAHKCQPFHTVFAEFGNVRIVGPEPLVPGRDPLLVGLVLEFLEVRVDHDEPLNLLGLEHDLLVAQSKGGGNDGDLLVEACRRILAVEGDVVAADQQGEHHIRLRALDALDDRAEVDHVERDEFLAQQFALGLLEVYLHPVSGDVTVVVVGRQGVELGSVLLDGPRYQIADLLRWRHAGAENVLVAHAALILLIVEVEGAVLVDDRPDRLARGAGDAAHQRRHLVLQEKLCRILGIELIVGLRIELGHAQLLTENAARRVDIINREARRIDHRQAIDVDRPCRVRAGCRLRFRRTARRRDRKARPPRPDQPTRRRVDEVLAGE